MHVVWNLLLYNRPEHSRRVLQSIGEAGVKHIVAYIDAPANKKIASKQNKIRDILGEAWPFTIDIRNRIQRHGLALSIRKALEESFAEGAGGAVVLEDDCVLLPGARTFFEEGLQNLKDDKRVRSLCGYNFPSCRFVHDHDSELLLLHRFSTWGWATWSDRWKDYEEVGGLSSLLDTYGVNADAIESFAPDQAQLCRKADYLDGTVDIWSVPWILLHFLTSTFAVYPRETVVQNIGMDGSGLNCDTTSAFDLTDEVLTRQNFNWKRYFYFSENEELIRKFMAEHGLKTYPSA